jgi:hypothetical protein
MTHNTSEPTSTAAGVLGLFMLFAIVLGLILGVWNCGWPK